MVGTAFICTACGTQFAPSDEPPPSCPICDDERQYVPPGGQAWTSLPRLQRSHMPTFRDESGVLGIGLSPTFGIGQRALLIRTPAGNVLWECVSLVNETLVEIVNGLGGLAAIAISHPHYYTSMVDWSRAFGDVPIYLHEADRRWIMRPDPAISSWSGDAREVLPGLTLIRCGGHFAGGTVLHWEEGAGGRGALFSGDILQVVADRRHLGFMRSYPNFIPLGATAVRRIRERLAPYRFDAIYGAFWNAVIPDNATTQLDASIERHIAWLSDDRDE
jgi:glyoxylase-like metal-dependent hydrolase (beta-lactamase superfamily II)